MALEDQAARAFAVLDPVLLTITNWPQGKVEEFETEVHPKRPELGTRKIPFSGYDARGGLSALVWWC